MSAKQKMVQHTHLYTLVPELQLSIYMYTGHHLPYSFFIPFYGTPQATNKQSKIIGESSDMCFYKEEYYVCPTASTFTG
ncbi:hypothetical protein XELAEV_18026051mg [Xenopus laevis]|uniref:Uncharacterized protein n=1 Tax=Xenopus laevis TaxID=8355 RepID=A0A974CUY4_XENLA|nr:hypothetical protein XELAEV_18026051mg [Xenopus laevis]